MFDLGVFESLYSTHTGGATVVEWESDSRAPLLSPSACWAESCVEVARHALTPRSHHLTRYVLLVRSFCCARMHVCVDLLRFWTVLTCYTSNSLHTSILTETDICCVRRPYWGITERESTTVSGVHACVDDSSTVRESVCFRAFRCAGVTCVLCLCECRKELRNERERRLLTVRTQVSP